MIEINNVYKRYHNHHGSDWVLKDINLNIPKGLSVGLIGANGAGKSTLLRLIAGMDTPERGEVIRHSRVSWPVGLSGGMQGNMTGRQNVKFVARVQGGSNKEVKRILAFVEDFAEIGEAFDEPIRTYSSGMKSRISFGLSLAFDFDVYISDEATAVGDRAFKAKAQELFKKRVGKSSLIMVSHSEGILRDLCQSGIYIKEGKALWYDNIIDAIYDYHSDVDGPSGGLSKGDELNSDDLSVLVNSEKKYSSGLGAIVKLSKKEKFKAESIEVIATAYKKSIRDVSVLTEKFEKTQEGKKKKNEAEIGLLKKIIDSLESLKVKNINLFSYGEREEVDSLISEFTYRKKMAEIELEAIDD